MSRLACARVGGLDGEPFVASLGATLGTLLGATVGASLGATDGE